MTIQTYRYFRPEHGGSIEHSYEFQSNWKRDNADWIAEDAADNFHSEHDGWEASWPMKLSIVFDDGTIETFEVERETVPTFSAARV